MKVLVACEFSAIVRDAFRARGHDAWSCDILPCEGDPQWHYQCDVMEILPGGRLYQTMMLEGQEVVWDLMIAHPPCTYLCRTSEQWLHKQPERWQKMLDAVDFFNKLLSADIPKIAAENPRPNSVAAKLIPKPAQCIQPYNFGDPASKATCLWLKGLTPLVSTMTVKPETVRSKRTGREWGKWFWDSSMLKGEERSKFRSRTFPGIARAMADQWG